MKNIQKYKYLSKTGYHVFEGGVGVQDALGSARCARGVYHQRSSIVGIAFFDLMRSSDYRLALTWMIDFDTISCCVNVMHVRRQARPSLSYGCVSDHPHGRCVTQKVRYFLGRAEFAKRQISTRNSQQMKKVIEK